MKSWHSRHSCLANIPFWKKKAQRFLGELEEPFADVIHGRFQLLSGFGRLVHLKCVTCGKGFHIHPYSLGLGCGCPFAKQGCHCSSESTGDFLSRRQITNWRRMSTEEAMGERVSILHKTCGNVRKTRLMETLWMQKKCDCETKVSFSDATERVRAASTDFTLIRYIGGKRTTSSG